LILFVNLGMKKNQQADKAKEVVEEYENNLKDDK
jgi:hypothetical protein